MFACICRGLTESDVVKAGRAGALGSDALIAALGLDDARCCGRCVRRIDEFVELAHRGVARAAQRQPRLSTTRATLLAQ